MKRLPILERFWKKAPRSTNVPSERGEETRESFAVVWPPERSAAKRFRVKVVARVVVQYVVDADDADSAKLVAKKRFRRTNFGGEALAVTTWSGAYPHE